MRIIAGEARGRTIEAPRGRNTRPTLDRVRENLFNMLQGYTEDSRVLDLFAGSGALSLESLSRGAVYAVMVDHDRSACEIQRKNIISLGFTDRVKQLRSDWQKATEELRAEGQTFDLIFLDPPYGMAGTREVFEALKPLTSPESLIVLEHQSGVAPEVPEEYSIMKQRNWGYCGVSIYRLNAEEPAKTDIADNTVAAERTAVTYSTGHTDNTENIEYHR